MLSRSVLISLLPLSYLLLKPLKNTHFCVVAGPIVMIASLQFACQALSVTTSFSHTSRSSPCLGSTHKASTDCLSAASSRSFVLLPPTPSVRQLRSNLFIFFDVNNVYQCCAEIGILVANVMTFNLVYRVADCTVRVLKSKESGQL